jgi:thiopeptide-type bacteriocin biosynthesis protein
MSGFSSTFFALRTPLLPFAVFRCWSDGVEAPGVEVGDARLSDAIERDRGRLRARLREAFSSPEGREALLVASADLAEAFELWVADPNSARGQGVERALARYFARMAGRPTPFGLFAGVSVGVVGEKTRLEIEGREAYRRSSRLDLGYLFSLISSLVTDPQVQAALTYRPNDSLYRAGGRLRYVESRLEKAAVRHELVAVATTAELDATLARAEPGATIDELARPLADDGVSLSAAESYVRKLVGNELLVPELAIPVTGPEPLDAIVEDLGRQEPTSSVGTKLDEVRRELAALDERPIGADDGRYRAVTSLLATLPAELDRSRLFQVDLFKPAPNATLGKRVIDELLRGIEALRRLTPAPAETDLDRFREAFGARYERREVPMLEVLDPDLGIGFPPARPDDSSGAPLLAGLSFPGEEARPVKWGKREGLLLRKLAEAVERREHEIVVEPDELEGIGENNEPLPDSFAVLAAVAARSQESLTQGHFRLLIEGVDGPSGLALLGRFCHGDPELRRRVEEHARAEEALRPDSIFAELVHLPQGRIGNVVCRPVLREYEITYLGRSGAPAERRIPVQDLLLSLQGNELVLRSERLGRRVIPRLTSAHDFAYLGIPVYRFLASLQREGSNGALSWTWEPLEKAPFLPRVRLGRLVLSSATWNLAKEELRGLASFREVQAWRSGRRIPRLVALKDGHEVLPVDLDNVVSVESWLNLLKGREEAALVELFPGPDELCAEGPEGRFVHQLIVPFVREADAESSAAPAYAGAGEARRRFMPGSEWLSASLYLGPALADSVLLEKIRPLARELVGSGAADRWFFVRYGDPDWHLRVRFHGEPEMLRSEVQPALERAAERAWRLRFDTYEREVERYGGPEGIEFAERLFHVDSEAVLEVVAGLGADEDRRWRLALVGMDALLSDLGLDLEAKEALAKRRREAFLRELRADGRTKGRIGQRFRRERDALESLIAEAGGEAFARRSERLRSLVDELRAARLTVSVDKLAESFVHMHVNRMLRCAHREQELVLWDFLARLYRSRLAREG